MEDKINMTDVKPGRKASEFSFEVSSAVLLNNYTCEEAKCFPVIESELFILK